MCVQKPCSGANKKVVSINFPSWCTPTRATTIETKLEEKYICYKCAAQWWMDKSPVIIFISFRFSQYNTSRKAYIHPHTHTFTQSVKYLERRDPTLYAQIYRGWICWGSSQEFYRSNNQTNLHKTLRRTYTLCRTQIVHSDEGSASIFSCSFFHAQ